MESGLSKATVIAQLTKSPHGDLAQYAPVGLQAAQDDPNFFAHLVAWNQKNGSIRDAKVALPVLALTAKAIEADAELRDNALAHILHLDPRNMVRALRFSKGQPIVGRRVLARAIEQRLRDIEADKYKFDRVALQHSGSLKELYALLHIKPGNDYQRAALGFRGEKSEAFPKGAPLEKKGVFAVLGQLKNMEPAEAAGAIMERRIPFLVAMGALGAKAKDPAVVRALIGAMSATELVTNSKMLEKLGVKTNPALRAAYEAGLAKVKTSTAATLKTTQAAEAIGGSTGEKLRGVQEKQLDAIAVKGDWLVLADKSGSMATAIETARHVAAFLARVGEGNVHLVFYDTVPQYTNATGMEYAPLLDVTKRIVADGGTSPGVGLRYAQEKGLVVDGIVIVGDGNQNNPPTFENAYSNYSVWAGKQLPVYLFLLNGDEPNMLRALPMAGIEATVFDLRGGNVDYASLPNFAKMMRTNRYSLVEEILGTPLLRLADVLKQAA